jgi:hypothetical protein
MKRDLKVGLVDTFLLSKAYINGTYLADTDCSLALHILLQPCHRVKSNEPIHYWSHAPKCGDCKVMKFHGSDRVHGAEVRSRCQSQKQLLLQHAWETTHSTLGV